MAPTKLTDADRQDILLQYREPEETTSTIAARYGVSNSTISRILKQSLPPKEYDKLIHQKRSTAMRSPAEEDGEELDPPLPEPPTIQVIERSTPAEAPVLSSTPRRRQRRGAATVEPLEEAISVEVIAPPPETIASTLVDIPAEVAPYTPEPEAIQDILDEEILGEDFEEDEDDLNDLDEEDDDDDDDLADEDIDGGSLAAAVHIQGGARIQVLPFSEAPIPRSFYLVVDRSSELITRPLRDFAELGQIPEEEVQAKTLPIFDNHHLAKRFMRRMQRVVKVPDGRMLTKVSPYLQAKGITRLLIDGQIYSL